MMNLKDLISIQRWPLLVAALAAVSLQAADASSPGKDPPLAAIRALHTPPAGRVVHGMGQWEFIVSFLRERFGH